MTYAKYFYMLYLEPPIYIAISVIVVFFSPQVLPEAIPKSVKLNIMIVKKKKNPDKNILRLTGLNDGIHPCCRIYVPTQFNTNFFCHCTTYK